MVTAFGSDGLLVGIAGIDVYLGQLKGDLYAQVVAALSTRTRGTLPAPANLNLSCNYQVSISPTEFACAYLEMVIISPTEFT